LAIFEKKSRVIALTVHSKRIGINKTLLIQLERDIDHNVLCLMSV